MTNKDCFNSTDKRRADTCAIVGVNWGDEGKGRMVDLVAEDYDVIVRYQGGNNAGHTIKNDCGTFALNLLPSGIFRHEKMNILGNGMVVDIRHLCGEIEKLRAAGVQIDPENLMISERAIIVMPYHVALDGLEETRLSDRPYGSTKRGIAPVYGDKYMKKGIMMGELFEREELLSHLKDVLEFKNLQITGVYGGEPFAFDEMLEYLDTYGDILKPYIGDTGAYLRKAALDGKKILYEAQLGALRDIDFGIYPYTSSSSPLAAYAPIGSGTPDIPVNRVIGIVKAYSSCVGEGPFTCEWHGKQAEELREAGGEYGAATGRPRRVGPIDIVATRYGVNMQGATEIALTKLDVLSYMKEIPICIEYEIDGKITGEFPFPAKLERAKPVMMTMPGWGVDISGIRKYEDLPETARNYVEFVEKQLGCRISFVSVGPGREEIIFR
ncbi:MAG: adenylosuccinate synthase [Clostridia bacterium]|nr:adenylosuccinate synthase [Clostridia bacterium]